MARVPCVLWCVAAFSLAVALIAVSSHTGRRWTLAKPQGVAVQPLLIRNKRLQATVSNLAPSNAAANVSVSVNQPRVFVLTFCDRRDSIYRALSLNLLASHRPLSVRECHVPTGEERSACVWDV
jgi:hypothetical protein